MSSCIYTKQLAQYLAEVGHTPLPESIRKKTKQHLLDTIAAMISGTCLAVGRLAVSFVQEQGGARQASVPGTDLITTAINAAFVSAMAAHADETDDSHLRGRFHPGCAVIPAALAMAEHKRKNGEILLRAVATGYDIGVRATQALGFSSPRSGTHSTHSLGANFAATAAASVIAEFDANHMEYVLSYATQQASGIPYWHRDSQHIEKAFDFGGMGARNGVFATLFVDSGATAVTDSLTGEHSYIAAFAQSPNPTALIDGLGVNFEIMNATIKKWSVGSPIQAVLDAVMALQHTHTISSDDIDSVSVIIPDDRFAIVDNRDMPAVCLQHLVALAILDGDVTFATSHDQLRMQDPKILGLRNRIKAIASSELTNARPARQAIVEIKMQDGRSMRHHTRAVLGTPENPMPQIDVENKARDLISPVVGQKNADELIKAIANIEQLSDVTALRNFWTV